MAVRRAIRRVIRRGIGRMLHAKSYAILIRDIYRRYSYAILIRDLHTKYYYVIFIPKNYSRNEYAMFMVICRACMINGASLLTGYHGQMGRRRRKKCAH